MAKMRAHRCWTTIAAAARGHGCEVILTSPRAASGTDRLAEAALSLPADIYVNIQGDEPLMSPQNIDRAVEALLARDQRRIATLTIPLPAAEAPDPNVVKAAVAKDGRALYFSRSAIPFPRGGEPAYRKHLGLYAYRAETLAEARERIAATHGDETARRAVIRPLETSRANKTDSAAA